MNIFDERIVRLIRLYLSGALSEGERQELELWIDQNDGNRRFFEDMKQGNRFAEEFPEFCQIDMERGWVRFEQHIRQERRNSWRRVLKYVAAIVVPVAIGFSIWLLNREEKNSILPISEMIEPGQVKATLELPGGKTLALKDMKQGEIEVDKGLKAMQTTQGLVYDSTVVLNVEELKFNTLKIPRGGEFRLTLADGTRVILNSATRLKYPVAFGQRERKVYLDGEAYFEVTKNVDHPFIVRTEKSAIRVLGTSFNVCSYTDDKFEQTTLVNGAVEVLYRDQLYRLKPGEQFEMQAGNECPEVKKVDVKLYMSWQEGIFRFQDMPLDELVLKLQRWYNVNFFFANESCRKYHFTGAIRKDVDFKEFIDLIELVTKVQFSVKENTIIISEK